MILVLLWVASGNNHAVFNKTITSDGSPRWEVSPLLAAASKGREGV